MDAQYMEESTNNGGRKNKNYHLEKETKEPDSDKSMGPTVVLLWVWGWVSVIPKTVASVYTDLKSGKLLARFTFLDAMMQFLVAVATSCHPQDDGNPYGESYEDEIPAEKVDASKHKVHDGVEVFGGTGRTLRSRVVETET